MVKPAGPAPDTVECGRCWDGLFRPRESELNRILRHVALPALAPLAVVGLFFTPLTVVGCATRGLLALGVVLGASAGAFVAIGLGFRARRRGGDPDRAWWLLTAAILTLPLGLVLGPLG